MNEKRRIEKPGNIASIRAESLAVVFGDDDADQKYWQARAGYDAGYEDALRWANLRTQDQAERIAELEAALREVSAGGCCQTPGCSIDDPKCDAMIARAALRGESHMPEKHDEQGRDEAIDRLREMTSDESKTSAFVDLDVIQAAIDAYDDLAESIDRRVQEAVELEQARNARLEDALDTIEMQWDPEKMREIAIEALENQEEKRGPATDPDTIREQAREEERERIARHFEELGDSHALDAADIIRSLPDQQESAEDRELYCVRCQKRTPQRFRPSPDAGPHWRCGECGGVTINSEGATDESAGAGS